MLSLLAITTLFLTVYVILILTYAYGWHRQPAFKKAAGFIPHTAITVIIPARNEAEHIEACVQSILDNDYPTHLLEIMVVDDHSEDETAALVARIKDHRVRLISLAALSESTRTQAYKKKALSLGISQSKGTLLVTTDADCTAPRAWLQHLAAIYESKHPAMIVAPVDFDTQNRLVEWFQSLDFMTMQGITAATHLLKLGNMSNGANLAFTREAFEAVGGYQGIDHLATGDDYLLMVKMQQQFPQGIAYLKNQEAIVRTKPQPDWPSFFNQRVRWASKSGKYKDHKLTVALLLVYLTNVMLVISGLALLLQPIYLPYVLALLGVKIVSELVLLLPVAGFFHKRKQLWAFPLLQPLHLLYIVSAGMFGFAGKYRWKGRTVR